MGYLQPKAATGPLVFKICQMKHNSCINIVIFTKESNTLLHCFIFKKWLLSLVVHKGFNKIKVRSDLSYGLDKLIVTTFVLILVLLSQRGRSMSIRAKEEKTHLSKGFKIFCPRAIHGDFFWGTTGCSDFEKLKILLWGLLSHKFSTTTRLYGF